MTRRRQTISGMQQAKKAASNQPAEPQNFMDRLLGNPQSRTERDEAFNRLILRFVLALSGLVAVIVLIALIIDQVLVPGQAVARVNGQAITVAQFRDQVRFERARITSLAQGFEQQAQQLAQQFGVTDQQQLDQFLQQFFGPQYEQYQTWTSELGFPDQLGQRVLNEMVDALLVEQEATRLNITVDSAAVQGSIDEFFGYDPTQTALIGAEPTATTEPTITPTPFVSPTPTPLPTLTPTPTPTLTPTPEVTAEATGEATAEATPEATPPQAPTIAPSPTLAAAEVQATYEANVRNYRDNLSSSARIGQSVIDNYFRQQALREAIGQSLLGEGNTTLYVNARHILVNTTEEAQEILAALQAGESFADLARAASQDTGSGANGGELGWSPAANYVAPFEQAVRDAEIGAVVGPVESEFGFHIIQVRAREDREVPEAERNQITGQLFSKWLATLRENSQEGIEIYDNWTNYVPQN